MDGLRPEEVGADERDHAGVAAAVLAQVDDDGVGVGEEVEDGGDRLGAALGVEEAAELDVADVARQALDLLEAVVDARHLAAELLALGGRRLAPPARALGDGLV